ncbi:hypothetical protein, partial [Allofournierella massiliensis]|uniref:hypothetical protein n=1 Tax=Allofournierella massiliensis TaxID=1650663 RepID=UPI0024B25345
RGLHRPGTLGGCQGALTLQSRKSGPFPALFSYVTPAKTGAFFVFLSIPTYGKEPCKQFFTVLE